MFPQTPISPAPGCFPSNVHLPLLVVNVLPSQAEICTILLSNPVLFIDLPQDPFLLQVAKVHSRVDAGPPLNSLTFVPNWRKFPP